MGTTEITETTETTVMDTKNRKSQYFMEATVIRLGLCNMDAKFVDELSIYFGKIKISAVHKDWCLISINPLPPKNEIEAVLSDLYQDVGCNIKDGKIRHSDTCEKKEHLIPKRVADCISLLKDDNFKIAISVKEDAPPFNQPLAICLNPFISYFEYPDHMHINAPTFRNGNLYVPESICYNKDPSVLGTDSKERIQKAIGMIVIWMFRHQVWLATRECYGMSKGIWVGKHTPYFDNPSEYFLLLNPLGKCRCGSMKLYKDCCMAKDASEYRKTKPDDFRIYNWLSNMKLPRDKAIEQIKDIFDIT